MWKVPLIAASCSAFSLFLILTSLQNGLKDEESPVWTERTVKNGSSAPVIGMEPDLEDSTLSPEDATTCRKSLMVMTKKLMKYYVKCLRDMKEMYMDKQDLQDHLSCVLRCSMRATGSLDAEFRMTDATVHAFFNGIIPAKFRKSLLNVSKKCRVKYMPLLNGEDPLCKVHGDFVTCMQDEVSEKCVASEYKIEV